MGFRGIAGVVVVGVDTSFNHSLDEYLLIPLNNFLPGRTVYVEVSYISSTAAGGLYELSAGEILTSEIFDNVFLWPMFLPAIINIAKK